MIAAVLIKSLLTGMGVRVEGERWRAITTERPLDLGRNSLNSIYEEQNQILYSISQEKGTLNTEQTTGVFCLGI
ncbi:MAG: hypothetical protein SAL70_15945 [Scytonema sp. PMC 1070.18]|nr:hypothetical protein [Scytonema sp. PMC 1070.18]